MVYWRGYMEAMIAAQQAIMEREASHIEEAARVITQSLQRDGVLHMFGSGHSHLPPEEAFYLCWLLRISVPKKCVADDALKSFSAPSLDQADSDTDAHIAVYFSALERIS